MAKVRVAKPVPIVAGTFDAPRDDDIIIAGRYQHIGVPYRHTGGSAGAFVAVGRNVKAADVFRGVSGYHPLPFIEIA